MGKLLPIVKVRWVDAFIDTNDISIKKASKLKPIVRTTVGFLVKEKTDCIVLATDQFEKGKEVSAPMVIPTGWILEFWEYET
jgi:hypothetical protein